MAFRRVAHFGQPLLDPVEKALIELGRPTAAEEGYSAREVSVHREAREPRCAPRSGPQPLQVRHVVSSHGRDDVVPPGIEIAHNLRGVYRTLQRKRHASHQLPLLSCAFGKQRVVEHIPDERNRPVAARVAQGLPRKESAVVDSTGIDLLLLRTAAHDSPDDVGGELRIARLRRLRRSLRQQLCSSDSPAVAIVARAGAT